MPIHNMNYEGGIFFTKQVGYVDNVDARMWSNALKNYAKAGDAPVVAVIDMREVERLCPTVVKVVAAILPQVAGIAIVASDQMSSRNGRVLSKLMDMRDVRLFATTDDGYSFARTRLNPSFGAAMSYTYAVAAAF